MKIKIRHKVVTAIASPVCTLLARFFYGYRPVPFGGSKRAYLILSNHVSMLDPIFVGLSFKFPLYYVAADNVFKIPFWSRLLVYLVSPIPKMKGVSDLSTIREMVSASKQGGSVCLFPNGNTTYSGDEQHIGAGLSRLVKLLRLPLVIYNLHGLYGVDPRWSRTLRRGPSYGKAVRVIEYQEYKNMDNNVLDNLIKDLLSVRASDSGMTKAVYRSSKRAEYLERVIFLCPECKRLHTFFSKGSRAWCTSCGYTLEYTENLSFNLLHGSRSFNNVKELYDFQTEYFLSITAEHLAAYLPVSAEGETFGEEIRGKPDKTLMRGASVSLDMSGFTVSSSETSMYFPIQDIEGFAVHGRNKILFFTKNRYFFLAGKKRRSALMFLYVFYTILRLQGRNDNGFFGI